jgi:hypothetical protein
VALLIKMVSRFILQRRLLPPEAIRAEADRLRAGMDRPALKRDRREPSLLITGVLLLPEPLCGYLRVKADTRADAERRNAPYLGLFENGYV